MSKQTIKFNPLSNTDDRLRSAFWDEYADNFVSIGDALSSASYFKGELIICRQYLKNRKKSGRFLKLDLWNEVHHTPLIDHIHKYYNEVHGIDIAPGLVKKAQENLKRKGLKVVTKVGDIRALPYKDNYFDFIYTMGTVEHIPNPFDAVKEIFRVLKPGGRAVIGVPNKYEWFGKSIILDILADTGFKEDGRELSYSWNELSLMVKCAGFKMVAKTGPYFMPWFIRLADWYFYQKSPKLKYLMSPFIYVCDLLSNSNYLRSHGSLLAAVVEKPKNV
jgi:SAM-dependent methyltransferase